MFTFFYVKELVNLSSFRTQSSYIFIIDCLAPVTPVAKKPPDCTFGSILPKQPVPVQSK